MSESKDSLIMVAKLSEKEKRYDDMAEAMKKVVEYGNHKLSNEERNLLSVAYKNAVGVRLSYWKAISIAETTPENEDEKNAAMAKEKRMEIETELTRLCKEVQFLIKNAFSDDSKVFYLTMKGDHYRYLAEVNIGSEREDVVIKAENAYKDAMVIATDKLASHHPYRLGLALNLSLFYYDIKKNQEKAYELAKETFDEAIAELDSLNEDSYEESTLALQLLKDNITLWKSDGQEENN